MRNKVIVPGYIRRNPYFWYVNRCLYKMEQSGLITIGIDDIEPTFSIFVGTIKIDGKPIIIDVRDDINLPWPEARLQPIGTKILKANYSLVLWNNPPTSFEYRLTTEELNLIPNTLPFIFGRSFSWDFDVDEKKYCSDFISPVSKEIVSLTGPGLFNQQTINRLNFYDLIKNTLSPEKIELLWIDKKHYQDSNKLSNYKERISVYSKPSHDLFGCYGNYIKWLSTGKYSLNFPGIAASQPFRLIDAVLAQRKIISTPMWIESSQAYPTILVPTDGYFSFDEQLIDQSKQILQNLSLYDYDLAEAQKWYDTNLSVEGMWAQLTKGLQ